MGKTYEERLSQYKVDLAAFEAQHPAYCRKCGGTGVVVSYESHEFWGAHVSERVEDVCPSCVGDGKCPLCGAEIPEELYEMPNKPRCPVCGWEDGKADQPVAPEPPDPY